MATGSAVLWLAVQIDLHWPLTQALDAGLGSWRAGLTLRSGFNPLAWQVLFMTGVVLGALTSTKQLDWSQVFRPEAIMPVRAAGALLLFFAGLRLCVSFELLPDEVIQRIADIEHRTDFGLIGLLNFTALAYAVAWLLIAGPRSAHQPTRRVANLATALFQPGFLRRLARHSRQVYAFHVIIIYVVKSIDWHYGPFTEVTKVAIAGTAVALMTIPAVVLRPTSPRSGPAAFGPSRVSAFPFTCARAFTIEPCG